MDALCVLPQLACALLLPAGAPGVRVTHTHRPQRACVVLEDETPDVGPMLKDANSRMKKSVSNVAEQLSTLRVGRATSDMLDRVQVEYYGCPTPLNQLASVSTPSASQLVVDVYDKSCLGDVERALFESDLGMTPSNDGSVIRLNVPVMTAERRKELAKTAKTLGEDGKVALRNIRRDVVDKIKKAQKKGLSEDQSKDGQDELDKILKKFEKEIGDAVQLREKEITTV